MGDGIAIPHVRKPLVLNVRRPSLALCFLERPIDYGALDGKPVGTLFTIIEPDHAGALTSHVEVIIRPPRLGGPPCGPSAGAARGDLAEDRLGGAAARHRPKPTVPRA